MKWSLFRRRQIPWPTWRGWLCFLALVIGPVMWWFFQGEAFLSRTRTVPARILIIEAWVGRRATQAAASEFREGGYDFVVATGGVNVPKWGAQRWLYPEMAERGLREAGIEKEKIIVAVSKDVDKQRTFESAAAAWRALKERGIQPKSVNVFTIGPHARRSRLVCAKTFGSEVEVGCIGWAQPGVEKSPWWKSSERSKEFIIETIGFANELLLNSGRRSNAPGRGEE